MICPNTGFPCTNSYCQMKSACYAKVNGFPPLPRVRMMVEDKQAERVEPAKDDKCESR